MANDKQSEHILANDGTDWTTPPSPVDLDEKIAADRKVAEKSRKGAGPSANNEPR